MTSATCITYKVHCLAAVNVIWLALDSCSDLNFCVLLAQFIGSLHLPALDYSGWCNIIVAKYGDLYWSEELLASLYDAVHGKRPNDPSSSTLDTATSRYLKAAPVRYEHTFKPP